MAQMSAKLKAKRRLRRKRHIRRNVSGTQARPRMSVFRSVAHIYVQLVDDEAGHTLCSASTLETDLRGAVPSTGNCGAAKAVGEKIAARAGVAGVKQVVFDRNVFKYNGRVKALADAAREGGMEF